MRNSSSIDCRPRREQFAEIHTHVYIMMDARAVSKGVRTERQEFEHKRALEIGAARVVLEAAVAQAI
eukprot:11165172-Lingulodinium_polyedra.AAC.1